MTDAIATKRIAQALIIATLLGFSGSPAWAYRWDLSEHSAEAQNPEDQARLIDEEAAASSEMQRQVGEDRFNQRMEDQKSVAEDLTAEAARRYQRIHDAGQIEAEHAAREEQMTHLIGAVTLTLVLLVSGVWWIKRRNQTEFELR